MLKIIVRKYLEVLDINCQNIFLVLGNICFNKVEACVNSALVKNFLAEVKITVVKFA